MDSTCKLSGLSWMAGRLTVSCRSTGVEKDLDPANKTLVSYLVSILRGNSDSPDNNRQSKKKMTLLLFEIASNLPFLWEFINHELHTVYSVIWMVIIVLFLIVIIHYFTIYVNTTFFHSKHIDTKLFAGIISLTLNGIYKVKT